jgi:hypothetical protein
MLLTVLCGIGCVVLAVDKKGSERQVKQAGWERKRSDGGLVKW